MGKLRQGSLLFCEPCTEHIGPDPGPQKSIVVLTLTQMGFDSDACSAELFYESGTYTKSTEQL